MSDKKKNVKAKKLAEPKSTKVARTPIEPSPENLKLVQSVAVTEFPLAAIRKAIPGATWKECVHLRHAAMKKLLIVLALTLIGVGAALADSTSIEEDLTTVDSVQVSIGCWNPVYCGSPEAYWSLLGRPVPQVEPPGNYFNPELPVAENCALCATWDGDAPSVSAFAAPVATPENSTGTLFLAGMIALVGVKLLRR